MNSAGHWSRGLADHETWLGESLHHQTLVFHQHLEGFLGGFLAFQELLMGLSGLLLQGLFGLLAVGDIKECYNDLPYSTVWLAVLMGIALYPGRLLPLRPHQLKSLSMRKAARAI